MASAILHIKDSYYFEVPKILLRRNFQDKSEFPSYLDVWVKLDDQFQEWEFHNLVHKLESLAEQGNVELPPEQELHHGWHEWMHGDHAHHGKPFDVYLEEHAQALLNDYQAWLKQRGDRGKLINEGKSFDEFLQAENPEAEDFAWFATLYRDNAWRSGAWQQAKNDAGNVEAFKAVNDPQYAWSEQKLAAYNSHLSGKIVIPQPFGELRNLYQPESGFCISKFMVVELIVGLIMLVAFSWVARRASTYAAPRGRLWNLLEVFLVFIRDQVAGPAIGGGHHEEHGHDHGHGPGEEVHDERGHAAAHGSSHGDVVVQKPVHHATVQHTLPPHASLPARPVSDADRFTPVLWTIFFFVLLCNLFGILPWFGSPTASFSVTLALAGVTAACVVLGGMARFGFVGFFFNQVPSMDLPVYMAVVLKPMIFLIEMLGLMIKHGVLAIRLLANMVAGHLVILGIMGLAFGAQAALAFSGPDVPGWQWPLVAVIAVVASTLFSILELFVAFLQAYIFTFLSALFIGAAVHKH